MGDIFQIFGDELGTISISELRLASQINNAVGQFDSYGTNPQIEIIAHSQGAAVANGAFQLLDSQTLSDITYNGNGAETFVGNNYGLQDPTNYWNQGDPVPFIGNFVNPLKIIGNIISGGYDTIMPGPTTNLGWSSHFWVNYEGTYGE